MTQEQPEKQRKNGLFQALEARFGNRRTTQIAGLALSVPVRTVRFWCRRGAIPYARAKLLSDRGFDLSGLPVDKKERRGRPTSK